MLLKLMSSLPNDGVLVGALEEVGAKVKVIDYPILRRKYF